MISKELLIFDLDGTLIDSSSDIAWAANRTLSAFGRKEEDAGRIKDNIGWGVKALLERLMPSEPPERISEARLKFLEFYGGHLVVDTCLYDGVRETIGYFREKNKKMAIVTNKPERLSVNILERFGLSGVFSMVVGGDSLVNRKPHPEPLLKVMDSLGVRPERSVFIGDSPIDSETGRKAGVFTIGVSYGFRGGVELESAGFGLVINRFPELMEILE